MKGSDRALFHSVIDNIRQARTSVRYAEIDAVDLDRDVLPSGAREDIALIIDMIDDVLTWLSAEAKEKGIGD